MNYYKGERETSALYAGGSFYRSEVRSDVSFSCSEIYADGSFCDFARVRFTALRCTFGCLVLRVGRVCWRVRFMTL